MLKKSLTFLKFTKISRDKHIGVCDEEQQHFVYFNG